MIPTFVTLDFETANQSRDSACSIGLVRVSDWQVKESLVELIEPPTSEFDFTHIHGITWENVKDKPRFDEVWPKIQKFISSADYLVAHNAPFDKGVLESCCRTYGLRPPKTEWQCTLKLARSAWTFPDNKLSTVCKHLGIALNHHEALSDARACAEILIKGRKFLENNTSGRIAP